MALIQIGNVNIDTKKIIELPAGTPDKNSIGVFSDMNGKAYKFPLIGFLREQDYSFKDSAIVPRPLQKFATVQLVGDMSGIGKDLPVEMIMSYKDEYGTSFSKPVSIEWQGNTSLSDPKKGYSFDLLNLDGSEFKVKFGNWVQLESYHLKSNYSDVLGVRNIVIARVAHECMLTRPYQTAFPWSKPFDFEAPVEDSKDTGARGCIDGFAIELFINGDSQGLYSWNLSRKRQNYNMDKDEILQILASAEDANAFPLNPPYFTPSSWDFKNPKFDEIPPEVTDAMTRLLTFIQTSTQAEFNTDVSQYLDLDYLIDYYILSLVFLLYDNKTKNFVFASYDGLIFFPVLYDMDRSIGLRHDPPNYINIIPPSDWSDIYDPVWDKQLLFVRLRDGFLNEVKIRYAELRKKILNYDHLLPMFKNMSDSYTFELYEKDIELWGGNSEHRGAGTSLGQVMSYIQGRLDLLDPQMDYTP